MTKLHRLARRWPRRLASVATLTLLVALWPARPAADGEGIRDRLLVLHERTLSAPVVWAFDVRWSGDDSLLVASGRDGLFEIALAGGEPAPVSVAGSQSLGYASRVALSETYMAAAASFGPLAWRPRGAAGAWRQDAPMGVVVDLDVAGDEVLLLGARRETVAGHERPQWAPDGGILFAGRFENGRLGPLTPRLTARSGPAGKAIEMARCHVLELGGLRFLSGGRYVVVPGVQPGILMYDPQGRLLHAWGTTSIGMADDCDLDDADADAVAADLRTRIDWWQRHTVLDDVVPWGDWFALVLRTPTRSGARWHLVPFDESGPQAALPLPVDAATPGIHLRADARRGRLALLLLDYEEQAGRPRHAPRLVVVGKEAG